MVEVPDDLVLPAEPVEHRRIALVPQVRDLERHESPGRPVAGPVDGSHSAAGASELDDLEPAVEDLPGLEFARVDVLSGIDFLELHAARIAAPGFGRPLKGAAKT